MSEPTPTTAMIATVANLRGRESKAEVLARAEKRLSDHLHTRGMDEGFMKTFRFYEARYNIAPGGDPVSVDVRCLSREGLSAACRKPLGHTGPHAWQENE